MPRRFFMTPSYGNPPHLASIAQDPRSKGFSSIDVDSPSGSTYMSVRPVDPKEDRLLKTPTATLADDIEAEGGDTPHLWRFRNLDEARMMRIWDQFRGLAPPSGRTMPRRTVFTFATWCWPRARH